MVSLVGTRGILNIYITDWVEKQMSSGMKCDSIKCSLYLRVERRGI